MNAEPTLIHTHARLAWACSWICSILDINQKDDPSANWKQVNKSGLYAWQKIDQMTYADLAVGWNYVFQNSTPLFARVYRGAGSWLTCSLAACMHTYTNKEILCPGVFLWTNLKPNNRWRQISGLDVRHKSSLYNTSDKFLKGRYHINEDKLDANMVVWKISCW